MTTFERFQRDARSRVHSNSKSLRKQQSQISSDDNLKNLLLFIYQYEGRPATFTLRMKNFTGYKIHFKVRSNNSKGYLVTPYEEVITDTGEISIKFEFLPVGDNLQAHRKDKFQIIWGKVGSHPGEPTSLTESKIFPVIIERTGEDFPVYSTSNKSYRAVEVPVLYQTDRKEEQEKTSAKVSTGKKSQNEESNTLLTKNNMIVISAVSFVMGFLLT